MKKNKIQFCILNLLFLFIFCKGSLRKSYGYQLAGSNQEEVIFEGPLYSKTGLCLGNQLMQFGQEVLGFSSCTGDKTQNWKILSNGQIFQKNSGLCVSCCGHKQSLILTDCYNMDAQNWTTIQAENSYYMQFINVGYNKCLENDNELAQLTGCNVSQHNQLFSFNASAPPSLSLHSPYAAVPIKSKLSGQCLDIINNTPDYKILGFTNCDPQNAEQQWIYLDDPPQIKQVNSGLCISTGRNYTTLIVTKCDDQDYYQQWDQMDFLDSFCRYRNWGFTSIDYCMFQDGKYASLQECDEYLNQDRNQYFSYAQAVPDSPLPDKFFGGVPHTFVVVFIVIFGVPTTAAVAALIAYCKEVLRRHKQKQQEQQQQNQAPVMMDCNQQPYEVKPGDTLSKIARRYNTGWIDIYELNIDIIKNPDLIYPGNIIRVPIKNQGNLSTLSQDVMNSLQESLQEQENEFQGVPVWWCCIQIPSRVKDIPINDLRMTKWLGQGGFAVVFQAEFKEQVRYKYGEMAEQQVALKVMSRDYFQNKGQIETFLKEAEMMSKLDNEYIVKLLGASLVFRASIVMELVPQGSLEGLLKTDDYKSCKTSILWKLKLFLHISKGIQYLHSLNIIHRDLKPANILIKEPDDAIIKITDFGLAKIQQTTQSGHGRVGTTQYMAPEMFHDEVIINKKSDIWALGIIMQEVLRGIKPWEGLPQTFILTQILQNKPPDNGALPTDCTEGLKQLIQSCWNPRDERPSAEEVVSKLQTFVQNETIIASFPA